MRGVHRKVRPSLFWIGDTFYDRSILRKMAFLSLAVATLARNMTGLYRRQNNCFILRL